MTRMPAALDGTVLDWFLDVPLKILIILAIAFTLQFILIHLINKAVRGANTSERRQKKAADRANRIESQYSDQVRTVRIEQRAGAIGTLLRSVVYVVIWTVAVLMILPLLDIDIAPLVASAGIAGVALGFGAQTLVKDYISGIFLIMEDQFGIGDIVEIDRVVGIVEVVALRYTRLRDADGVIWYIRNGEIRRVANQSQGWTRATVDLSIDHTAALEQVRDIITAESARMAADPDVKPLLLDDPEFLGVQDSGPGTIVVRVIAKVPPEDHDRVAAILRERVITALVSAGVPLAGAQAAAAAIDVVGVSPVTATTTAPAAPAAAPATATTTTTATAPVSGTGTQSTAQGDAGVSGPLLNSKDRRTTHFSDYDARQEDGESE